MEEAFKRKTEKYDGLVSDYQRKGWKANAYLWRLVAEALKDSPSVGLTQGSASDVRGG